MLLLYFFIFILIINFIYNYWCYRQCTRHIRRYEMWLFEKEYNEDLAVDRHTVTKLVKNAGLYNIVIPITRPTGLGQITNANIKPIDQYPDRMSDVAPAIMSQLKNAQGVYKERMQFSFNPLLWFEFIIFLPANIINYLGLENSIISKVLNVIWWILGIIVIPIIITVYSEEVTIYFKNIFN